jgi:serine/threonine protein kinase
MSIIKELSEGSYGKTFIIKIGDTDYCLKKYITKYFTDDFIREIYHLNQEYTDLNIYNKISNFNLKSIIIDLYHYDMLKLIKNNNLSNLSDIIFASLLKQVYNLHIRGFIHSDIKLNNILCYDNKFTLCDFGLCEFYGIPKVKKKYISTQFYKANDNRLSIACDIYSLGCSLFYLFSRFSVGFIEDLSLQHIVDNYNIISETLDNSYINILSKMILDENKRYSAKKILIKYFNYNPIYLNSQLDLILIRIRTMSNTKNIPTNNEHIFKELKIKKNRYINYTYYDIINKLYEIEYLDDIYTINIHNLYSSSICNKINTGYSDYISLLYNYYFNLDIHMETLFYSIYIFNYVYNNVKLDNYENVVITIVNFSRKILEFSHFSRDEILDQNLVQYLTKNIRHISFKSGLFYIYYYIFNIIISEQIKYYNNLENLETICLSILFLYLADINTYTKTSNIHNISVLIILTAIDFIKFNYLNLDDNFVQSIIINYKSLKKDLIDRIVELDSFREYLFNT